MISVFKALVAHDGLESGQYVQRPHGHERSLALVKSGLLKWVEDIAEADDVEGGAVKNRRKAVRVRGRKEGDSSGGVDGSDRGEADSPEESGAPVGFEGSEAGSETV